MRKEAYEVKVQFPCVQNAFTCRMHFMAAALAEANSFEAKGAAPGTSRHVLDTDGM